MLFIINLWVMELRKSICTAQMSRKETKTNNRMDHVTNHVVEDAKSAQKEAKTTRWTYKNDFYRFLFGIAGE